LITRMPRALAEAELEVMVRAMSREPFYVIGMWIDESLGVYVGWTVRRNAFADGMPLCDQRGAVLVFSGEEYSRSGPASRRLDLVEQAASPAALNGRFHGLLADRTRRAVTLFNDRYGMHRLYYHQSPDAFYFAAEAKAILEVRPDLRSADPRSLGEFTACGCVLENRTIFKGVFVLPPGAAWVFRQAALERRDSYFHPREWEEQDRLSPDAYYRELHSVFSSTLPRYFRGDERIGMSLTGGLDTRMIMAWTTSPSGSLPCYSFGGTFRESMDIRVAREVARVCAQPYEVIPIGLEFQSRFSHYAERTIYLTDGCLGVNHSADLYANERAREIAPVRLTGNYGGEVLRQVRAFKPVEPAAGLFQPEFLSFVRAATPTYARTLAGHPLSFAVFRQAPWHHYGLLALEETQLTLRSPYLDNDFVKTAFRAPESVLASNDVCLRLIADGSHALSRIPTDRGLGGQRRGLVAAAVRRFHEFTFRAEYVYDYGMPQWLARVDRRLSQLRPERLFLGRHKFCHFRVWYRDALAGYVQDILLDSRTLARPYLQRSSVHRMVQGHLRGDRNYTSEIHKLLTLELIHRLFFDAAGRTPATLPDGPACVRYSHAVDGRRGAEPLVEQPAHAVHVDRVRART
jgi:asparagine synthase (glutamine-hydrolysing)